jgi:hypothetical protein
MLCSGDAPGEPSTATARTAPSIGISGRGDQEETRYHQQGNHIDRKVTKHTQLGEERRDD